MQTTLKLKKYYTGDYLYDGFEGDKPKSDVYDVLGSTYCRKSRSWTKKSKDKIVTQYEVLKDKLELAIKNANRLGYNIVVEE